MLARLGFHGTEDVRGSTTFVFVIALGDLARTRREGRSQIRVERDRFFVQANHRLDGTIGVLINCQDVFHLADVLGVQVGDAPHFFPATASGRGWPTKPGGSRAPLGEQVSAPRLARRSAVQSTALVPREADYKPSQ